MWVFLRKGKICVYIHASRRVCQDKTRYVWNSNSHRHVNHKVSFSESSYPKCSFFCYIICFGGFSSLVGRDLAWGLEGGQSSYRPQYGKWTGSWRGASSLSGLLPRCPYAEAPNPPQVLTSQPTAPSLQCVCVCVYLQCATSDGLNAED